MGPSFSSATFWSISSSRLGSKRGLPASAFIDTISCTIRARSFRMRMSSRSTSSTRLLSSSILAGVPDSSIDGLFYQGSHERVNPAPASGAPSDRNDRVSRPQSPRCNLTPGSLVYPQSSRISGASWPKVSQRRELEIQRRVGAFEPLPTASYVAGGGGGARRTGREPERIREANLERALLRSATRGRDGHARGTSPPEPLPGPARGSVARGGRGGKPGRLTRERAGRQRLQRGPPKPLAASRASRGGRLPVAILRALRRHSDHPRPRYKEGTTHRRLPDRSGRPALGGGGPPTGPKPLQPQQTPP